MIKIRLSRKGSKKKPFYQIVVADVRCPQNGKFIEKIGFYDPILKNIQKKNFIKKDRVNFWKAQGASLSKRVYNIIKNIKKNYDFNR
ncbi:30S ribosomal protein S16 [Buchnera aphidicola (Ceratoglyphina bambusae)]|uniref:30S ribosomal protein S16 n=1 Tax=Buchnera aphidicola TaxID=9 RepID=UPI0031B7F115